MMKFAHAFAMTAVGLWMAGCQQPAAQQAAAPAQQEQAVAVAAPAASPAPAEHECPSGEAEQAGHECPPGEAAAPAAAPTGPTALGAALTDVAVVSLADLMANPDAYKDKVVRVEGEVIGMCHHKRDWFAVTDTEQKNQVRVITGHAFLVPTGSVGRKARAEGTVEVVEISAEQARHFAKDHKVGQAIEGDQPIKRVVIRVNGAEFI